MPHPTRQAIVRWAAAVLLVLVVVYPLSYAPFVKWKLWEIHERTVQEGYTVGCRFTPIDGSQYHVYRPVDWLIDNTALKQPLFAWARLWRVEEEFRFGAAAR